MNLPITLVITRGAYGPRHWYHHAFHKREPGWYTLELGAWSIEVIRERRKVPRWVAYVLAAAMLPAPFAYASNGYAAAAVAQLVERLPPLRPCLHINH